MGPCAKKTVKCTLVLPSGHSFVGTNWCEQPQAVCPRLPGEDYAKCKSVCGQPMHAELDALRVVTEALGPHGAQGARAFIEGHTYACMDCQIALFTAGVESISIGRHPWVRNGGR